MSGIDNIQVEPVPDCTSCGQKGDPLYDDLRDHTFGSPGAWAMCRCPRCRQIWLNPRPTERDVGKIYKTYYTHTPGEVTAGSTFHAHFKKSALSGALLKRLALATRRIQDSVLAYRFGYSELRTGGLQPMLANTLGLLPGMARGASLQVLGLTAEERGRLLDVGCGNGLFLARMRSLGWQTVGVETDAAAARVARENGLDVREQRLTEIGFPEASFDVVTLSHVIEHVHAPEDLIKECRRVLRPRGKLIILTPNSAGLGHRLLRRSWRGLEPPRHIQCFHPHTLRHCVERNAMRVERLTTESRMMQYIWYSSMRIRRAQLGREPLNSALDYVASYAMRLAESAALYFVRDAGEEIVLTAIKPDR